MLGLTGHTEQALRQLERALPLLVELGDQSQQASTLRSLGELQMQWAATLDKRKEATASAHHRQQAVTDLEAALRLFRACDDPNGEANTLRSLGQLHMEMGRFPEAKVRAQSRPRARVGWPYSRTACLEVSLRTSTEVAHSLPRSRFVPVPTTSFRVPGLHGARAATLRAPQATLG